jgi:hypothetical protein
LPQAKLRHALSGPISGPAAWLTAMDVCAPLPQFWDLYQIRGTVFKNGPSFNIKLATKKAPRVTALFPGCEPVQTNLLSSVE